MMRLTLSLSENGERTAVERAIAEIRSARPVLIEGEGTAVLAVAVEHLDADLCARLDAVALGRARLLLSAPRLRRLGLDRREAGSVAVPLLAAERILALGLQVEARIDAPVAPLQPIDAAALELARLAQVLPAVLVLPLAPGVAVDPAVLRVGEGALARYRAEAARHLALVGRAKVPLEGAPDSEFVVFRGGEGLRDQVAVVVGSPDLSKPVPVRLHSACLTGDLFGSLKCDCGDQLREAVAFMARHEGGILLYLDQEGRGNGIANKIRAYKLQLQGYDTYEADEVLGFDLDQRRFDFAGAMLRQLGAARVRLLTNNPDKIAALREAGLDVVADQRLLGRVTAENVCYLTAKRDRAGHLVDPGLALARSPARD